MKQFRKEYIDILRSLNGDPEGKRWAEIYMADSDCYQDEKPVSISFVPAFYDDDEVGIVSGICRKTHDILGKVILHYVENEDYRKIFNFTPDAERLITLPCNYAEPLPMSRLDFFMDEDDHSFRFCEFNADGTADMSFTRAACEAVESSRSFQKFARRKEISQFELFDSWVEEFMETYHSDKNAVEKPNVLIADFARYVTMSDIPLFVEAFERNGYKARFVDIGTLAFDGKDLMDPTDGMKFQAVYRRAVTSDILRNMEESRPLIEAVEQEKVCLIGHFRTTVIHSKMINVALLDDMTRDILTEEEWNFVQEHVLPTFPLSSARLGDKLSDIRNNKDEWVIKPADDYDAHGVFVGVDMSDSEWNEAVDKYTDNGYVAMKYYEPPLEAVSLASDPDYWEDEEGIVKWHSMTGAYTYNGNFHGFMNRMGEGGVISVHHDGIIVPVFHVKKA